MTQIVPDPTYTGPAAQYIRSAVRWHTGLDIVADDTLARSAADLDLTAGLLRVIPGLDLWRFHALVGWAAMRAIGGAEWAPEWRANLSVVHTRGAIGGPFRPGVARG